MVMRFLFLLLFLAPAGIASAQGPSEEVVAPAELIGSELPVSPLPACAVVPPLWLP